MTHLEMLQLLKKTYPAGPAQAEAVIGLKHLLKLPLKPEEEWFFGFMTRRAAAPDVHKHRCPSCKTIWEHDRTEIERAGGTEEAYRAAHLCPKGCGVDVRDRYIAEDTDHEMPFID